MDSTVKVRRAIAIQQLSGAARKEGEREEAKWKKKRMDDITFSSDEQKTANLSAWVGARVDQEVKHVLLVPADVQLQARSQQMPHA
jgi:hypothetical protein